MNVRLYVERDGQHGVWFLSLDPSNPLAVWGARRWSHLLYHVAIMNVVRVSDRLRFTSARRATQESVTFRGDYRPTTDVFEARPGSLEHFLMERYCLYCSAPNGILYRGQVHHVPWPLQRVQAELAAQPLVAHYNIAISGEPHLLFSRGVDVEVWPLERLQRI